MHSANLSEKNGGARNKEKLRHGPALGRMPQSPIKGLQTIVQYIRYSLPMQYIKTCLSPQRTSGLMAEEGEGM